MQIWGNPSKEHWPHTPKKVHPDPEKIKAIHHMPPPTDQKCAEWLLGTVNYFAKFVPNVSIITMPIQDALKKDFFFTWSQHRTIHLPKSRTHFPQHHYHNVNKPVVVSGDVSQSGLGVLLFQDWKPVAYTLCALFIAETRQVQIKKKLLAIDFSFTKFHQYVYSKN